MLHFAFKSASFFRVTPSRSRAVKPSRHKLATMTLSLMLTGLSTATLSGCQTIKQTPNVGAVIQSPMPERLQRFNIRGKIGVVTPQLEGSTAQSGSAFYVWAQDGDRFAIDLTGALGIGHTVIEYNGQKATLVSERTGTLTAVNPDDLLLQATGWRAPISQLPYWISGRPAPSDKNNEIDPQGRLQTADNADWMATFSYQNLQEKLPNKIKVIHSQGHKVIMTIDHLQP